MHIVTIPNHIHEFLSLSESSINNDVFPLDSTLTFSLWQPYGELCLFKCTCTCAHIE